MMVAEALSYSVTTNCDSNPTLAASVVSNQPVNDDGTAPDWIVIDAHHVQLRAERSEATRVYTITVTATDSAGASGSGAVTVKVPLANH
jgi:hypothetical protein